MSKLNEMLDFQPYPTPVGIQEGLSRVFYFRGLTEAQRQGLAQVCEVRTIDPGEMLFQEGDPATALFIVLTGQIQIYKLSKEGKEVILHLFGPGEIFAEVPIFCDLPHYPANAMARQHTTLLQVDGHGFTQLVHQHPEIALSMLAVFAKRLHEFSGIIEDLSLRSVEGRLAKYLLEIREASQHHTTIEIHKKTLAAILGTIPETLSRAFKKLSEEGLIQVNGNTIHLLNIPELMQRAE